MPLRKEKSKKRLLQVEKENLFKQVGSVKEFEISLAVIRIYYDFSAPVQSPNQHQSQLQQTKKLCKNASASPEKNSLQRLYWQNCLLCHKTSVYYQDLQSTKGQTVVTLEQLIAQNQHAGQWSKFTELFSYPAECLPI